MIQDASLAQLRKVTVLTTGGTIAHRSNKAGVAALGFDPAAFAAELGVTDVDLTFQALMRKGSMDVVPDDWATIAQACQSAIGAGVDGIVVLHGTDTMAYTAAALSFFLQKLPVPIVLTGSMIPGGDDGSDAPANLADAITVAAHSDVAEVVVVFSGDDKRSHGTIIRGSRARKAHTRRIDAFESVNVPRLGRITQDKLALRKGLYRTRPGRRPAEIGMASGLQPDVVVVKAHPGLSDQRLAQLLGDAAGAVIEGTGVGHLRGALNEVVARFAKPVVMTTQVAYGGEQLGTYDADASILAIPNLIAGGDMTAEAALVKLMWAIAQPGDTRALMLANIGGERQAQQESDR